MQQHIESVWLLVEVLPSTPDLYFVKESALLPVTQAKLLEYEGRNWWDMLDKFKLEIGEDFNPDFAPEDTIEFNMEFIKQHQVDKGVPIVITKTLIFHPAY